ncbi:MAG TPA: MFS transporter [Anaerolineaceae bacterium]|nr:MFS transporter [Anaerolineaceae bacterium]
MQTDPQETNPTDNKDTEFIGMPADPEKDGFSNKSGLIEPPNKWLQNYAPMFIGQIFSMLGSAVVQFALIWYLTEKTGSAAVLATASMVGLLPQVILGPFAGALVDRWNRKITMIVADLIVTLATIALMLLFALNVIQIWHIYVALFIRAISGIFQGPAMSASTTLMVPKEHYARLGGFNQALNGIINIVSPPLGALLLAVWPFQSVLAVDVVTAAIAILLLLFLVKVPQPLRSDVEEVISPKVLWNDVRSAFKYMKGWPGMFTLTIMAALINFAFAPSNTLLPLMITKNFGGGAAQLASVESAMGIGIVVGGLLLGIWGGFKRKIYTSLAGIVVLGFSILGMGLTPSRLLPLLIGFSGILGFALAFANGPLGAIFQAKIPPEMQGRTFMMLGSLCQLAMPLGIVLAAPMADHLGVEVAFTFSGVMALLVGIYGFMRREVYTLDQQEPGGKILVAESELAE